MSARSLIFILLALPAGFALAPLSGETAGIATLLVIPVVVILSQHKRTVGQLLAAVGAGYTANVALFIARSSWVFSGAGTLAYAASQLAIGAALFLTGLVLTLHYRQRTPGQPARPG